MSLKLVIGPDGGDLVLGEHGLETDDGLGSALLVSLFSDARARPGDLPGDPLTGRRGYWGEEPGSMWGSRLWLLEQRGHTQRAIADAEESAREALQWLLDEGICSAVEVTATRIGIGALHLHVRLVRGTSRRWQHVWQGLLAGTYDLEQFKLTWEAAA